MRTQTNQVYRPGPKALGLGLALLILAGCATGYSPTSSSVRPNGGTTEGYDPHGLIPAGGPHLEFIDEAVRIYSTEPMTEESIEFHREVFADGQITFAEYERGVVAATDCLRDLGYDIVGPYTHDLTGPGWSVEVGLDPNLFFLFFARNPPSSFGDDTTRCQDLWESRVHHVWSLHLKPTEAEKEAWLEAAWACGRERGVAISNPPTENQAIDAVGAGCEPWQVLTRGN